MLQVPISVEGLCVAGQPFESKGDDVPKGAGENVSMERGKR